MKLYYNPKNDLKCRRIIASSPIHEVLRPETRSANTIKREKLNTSSLTAYYASSSNVVNSINQIVLDIKICIKYGSDYHFLYKKLADVLNSAKLNNIKHIWLEIFEILICRLSIFKNI